MGTYDDWPKKKYWSADPKKGPPKLSFFSMNFWRMANISGNIAYIWKNLFFDMFLGPCMWILVTLHIIFLTKKNYLYFSLKTYMGLMSLYRRWDTTKMTPEFINLTKSKTILLRWFSLKMSSWPFFLEVIFYFSSPIK